MNTEQEREAFEDWILQGMDKNLPGHQNTLARYPSGNYMTYSIAKQWDSWQARAALQSQSMPPEISRGLLGKIVDEVFDGAIEDASVIEDIYRVVARECALQSQDREDAERYRAWRKAVASQNGNFLRLVSNELPDWDEGQVDEEKIDAAIDHARRIEGEGE